jgi:hypothetical protein
MKKTALVLILLILAAGCAYNPPAEEIRETIYYPPLPERPRLQFLHSISGGHDLGEGQSAFEEFLLGKPRYKQLGRPYAVGASKGRIYVMDRMYKRLVIIDLEEGAFSFLRDRGSGSLGNPSGIWISDDDFKYVADMQRKQVVVFDSENDYVRAYGEKGVLERPVDVAVSQNRLYVADMEKDQVIILDKASGELVRAVGEKGDFFNPTHLDIGPQGSLFVNDAFNFVIKKLSPVGDLIDTIGFHGDQLGGFARPKGLALDREGNLYVVDAAFENVQIFDNQGRLLLFFGGAGNGPGDMYLPAGIAVDYENVSFFERYADPNFSLEYLVYVVNTFGVNKLNVYGFGRWVGEGLPE